MGNILKEFKDFAMRGNVIDMAVGIIIGAAFGKIVSSLVGDIIMPAVGLLVGGMNFTDFKVVTPEVAINYGTFIQVTIDFIIVAFAIFLLIKGVNALSRKKKEEPATPPAPPADVQLLTEIRDLLKKN